MFSMFFSYYIIFLRFCSCLSSYWWLEICFRSKPLRSRVLIKFSELRHWTWKVSTGLVSWIAGCLKAARVWEFGPGKSGTLSHFEYQAGSWGCKLIWMGCRVYSFKVAWLVTCLNLGLNVMWMWCQCAGVSQRPTRRRHDYYAQVELQRVWAALKAQNDFA